MRNVVFIAAIVLAGCGGEAASSAPPNAPSSGAEPSTFSEQVAAGEKLYTDNCATCHGASGEGNPGPRVVGLDKGALPLDPPATAKYRKTQFKTAADVAGFVVKNMPPNGDPSLKESDYWSILAFDLHANGVDLQQRLDGNSAKDVVLHP